MTAWRASAGTPSPANRVSPVIFPTASSRGVGGIVDEGDGAPELPESRRPIANQLGGLRRLLEEEYDSDRVRTRTLSLRHLD